MTFQVYLRPEAEADLEDSAAWYERQREGLGHELLESVLTVMEAIANTPEFYPAVHREVRRAVVRRFPFGVYYRIEESSIVVVAIMHGSRHPQRWKVRT